MRLGKQTNGWNNEALMCTALDVFLRELSLTYLKEVPVPEVQRRADYLVIRNGLVNIEAKCNDYRTMMEQLKDHSRYCDYCFAYIPDLGMTPKWFKKVLQRNGFGLIVYNQKKRLSTEVLEAHHNKPQERQLRNRMLLHVRRPLLVN